MTDTTNVLVLPLRITTWYLPKDADVVATMADFTRLPYVDTKKQVDINADTPYVGKAVTQGAFQDQDQMLNAGLHLHWALPDALTAGTHTTDNSTTTTGSSTTKFPIVPNRWLVIRTHTQDPTNVQQWVVESDYVSPDNADNTYGSVSYPVSHIGDMNRNIPYCFLGRSVALKQKGSGKEYLIDKDGHELTAVGYGGAQFAAFYPNCHSVFGFYDDDSQVLTSPSDFTYEIIGYYSNASKDFVPIQLAQAKRELGEGTTTEATLQYLQEHCRWDVYDSNNQSYPPKENLDADTVILPSSMLCYGKVTFDKNADLKSDKEALKDTPNTSIAMANTGTEALVAYLAKHLADNSTTTTPAQVEDQLESLYFAEALQAQTLDKAAKLAALRHEKSFRAYQSGTLWTIRNTADKDTKSNDAKNTHERLQAKLPADVATKLHALNMAQRVYDQSRHKLTALAQQLYFDWYRYMEASYPPLETPYDYPDPDEIKTLISDQSLPNLNLQRKACDNLEQVRDENLQTLKSILAQVVSDDEKAIWVVKPTAAPRYWQPTDPVLCVVGDGLVEASKRHDPQSNLPCVLLQGIDLKTIVGPSPQSNILTTVLSKAAAFNQIAIIDNKATTKNSPWNPLFLEWEVEVFPAKAGSNLRPETQDYDSDYITKNYTLGTNNPEFAFKADREVTPSVFLFSGRSILTPYAQSSLLTKLVTYFKNKLLKAPESAPYKKLHSAIESPKGKVDTSIIEAYCAAENIILSKDDQAKQSEIDNLWKTHTLSIMSWYFDQHEATSMDYFRGNWDAGNECLYRAYEKLTDPNFHSLSQSIGGFNDALLMREPKIQLPIADPLGFSDGGDDSYQSFTNKVRDALKDFHAPMAPLSRQDFLPIRSGHLRLIRLRLVDTFGQTHEFDINDNTSIITPQNLRVTEDSRRVQLLPRLSQPARLDFRWLSAGSDLSSLIETNIHPETTPICGWILPNNLDESLMVYDNLGKPLGVIRQDAQWAPSPGNDNPVSLDQLNAHLQKMIDYLEARGGDFLKNTFIPALNAALVRIAPESFAQHQGLALLMGRPLALVRVHVQFSLLGKLQNSPKGLQDLQTLPLQPVRHLGWVQLQATLQHNSSTHNAFTKVQWPIRLGDDQQFNDGLVGYWIENDQGGYQENTFYSWRKEKSQYAKPISSLDKAIDSSAQVLSMVVDPRGSIHATTGVLPTKGISIPPALYQNVLEQLQINFRTMPMLMPKDQISVPLPQEPGYSWSWLEKRDKWQQTASKDFTPINTKAHFDTDLYIREGWLQLEKDQTEKKADK